MAALNSSPSPKIEALCAEQFEHAISPELQEMFVHCVDADDYYFGDTSGVWILDILGRGTDPAVVLDIGAGQGTYLQEAMGHTSLSGREIHPIGLTAIKHYPERAGITYIYGDVQRPATWNPPEVLAPESVDLAVSSLTFRHLEDPLRAFCNVMALLKPGGHLFTDEISVPLDPATSSATSKIVGDYLGANTGRYGSSITDEVKRFDPVPYLRISGHFQKLTEDLLGDVSAVISDLHEPKIVYTV